MVSDRVDEARVILCPVGVESIGERIHGSVGQNAEDPAAEVVGPPVVLPLVMIGMTFPAASVVTPMGPDPWTGTMMGVVGKGARGRDGDVQARRQVADEQAAAVVEGSRIGHRERRRAGPAGRWSRTVGVSVTLCEK